MVGRVLVGRTVVPARWNMPTSVFVRRPPGDVRLDSAVVRIWRVDVGQEPERRDQLINRLAFVTSDDQLYNNVDLVNATSFKRRFERE